MCSVRNKACPRDYLLGQVNNPLAVICQTSEKLQPDFICHYQCSHKTPKLEEFMSWQHPGSDCHRVTAGFRSNAFEVDIIGATTDALPRSGLSQDIM